MLIEYSWSPIEKMHNDLDIRSLLGTFRRQAKLIATIVLIIVAMATIVCFSLPPKFQATTLLYIDTATAGLLDDNARYTSNTADHSKVSSEVEIVKSDGVLLDLIEKMNLLSDDEFGVKPGRVETLLAAIGLSNYARLSEYRSGSVPRELATVIENLNDAVSVQRRGLTYIIAISAVSREPEKAALLANELSKSYIDRQLKSKINSIEASLKAVRMQVQDVEGNVLATQKNLNDFMAVNLDRIAQVNRGTTLEDIQTRLAVLQQQKVQSIIQRSGVLKGLGGGVWVSDISGLKSVALKELEAQRAQITGQISIDTNDPKSILNLRSQLINIQSQIVKESEVILNGINQTIVNVDKSINEFQSQLNNKMLSGEIVLPEDIGAQLYRLSQEAKNSNVQYQSLLAKAQELNAVSLLQTADSRIISLAIAPNSAIFPNIPLILAISGLFALGLGVASAFILENYIGGFTSVDQVEALTKVQVATSVPKLSKLGASTKSISELVIGEPRSLFAESIRRMRTTTQITLQRSYGIRRMESDAMVIMISSAAPMEGKSSIALSLARTLAFSGARTILIDCDVKKSGLAAQLGISSQKGLFNLLINKINSASLAENVVMDNLSNLHMVLGHQDEMKDVQSMLGFQPFSAIIEIARLDYDFIILDTPPIGPVTDVLALATYSDVVLFVIKWAKTSQKSVLESLKLIGGMAPNVPVLTVLNQTVGDADHSLAQYSGYYSDA